MRSTSIWVSPVEIPDLTAAVRGGQAGFAAFGLRGRRPAEAGLGDKGEAGDFGKDDPNDPYKFFRIPGAGQGTTKVVPVQHVPDRWKNLHPPAKRKIRAGLCNNIIRHEFTVMAQTVIRCTGEIGCSREVPDGTGKQGVPIICPLEWKRTSVPDPASCEFSQGPSNFRDVRASTGIGRLLRVSGADQPAVTGAQGKP